jgi:hypothetical protein
MLFPLLVRVLDLCPYAGTGLVILGSIEQCGGRWQAAARFGYVEFGKVPVQPAGTSHERGAAEAY